MPLRRFFMASGNCSRGTTRPSMAGCCTIASATAVGIPAQIVRIAGQTTHYADEVDQTSVKNPTLERLSVLSARLDFIEQLLDAQYLCRKCEEQKEKTGLVR